MAGMMDVSHIDISLPLLSKINEHILGLGLKKKKKKASEILLKSILWEWAQAGGVGRYPDGA